MIGAIRSGFLMLFSPSSPQGRTQMTALSDKMKAELAYLSFNVKIPELPDMIIPPSWRLEPEKERTVVNERLWQEMQRTRENPDCYDAEFDYLPQSHVRKIEASEGVGSVGFIQSMTKRNRRADLSRLLKKHPNADLLVRQILNTREFEALIGQYVKKAAS